MEGENELKSIIFIGTFLMLFLAFGLLFMVLFYQRHLAKIKKKETELLLKINQGLSQDNQGRYQLLINKRNEENLTEQEYQELLELSDQIEIHQTQRLEYLAQLARLRQISLTDLMTQLSIKPIVND